MHCKVHILQLLSTSISTSSSHVTCRASWRMRKKVLIRSITCKDRHASDASAHPPSSSISTSDNNITPFHLATLNALLSECCGAQRSAASAAIATISALGSRCVATLSDYLVATAPCRRGRRGGVHGEEMTKLGVQSNFFGQNIAHLAKAERKHLEIRQELRIILITSSSTAAVAFSHNSANRMLLITELGYF